MINLIAAYYENIWPFRDKSCSVIFDEWKYLIKAPIWSGKSFLFFDAPCYGLYKDSSRNMLNIHSKTWEISLIFEENWSYYLIRRNLKKSKMWLDSCSSQLFNISYTWDNFLKDIKNLSNKFEIIQRWENSIALFEKSKSWLRNLEEVTFKNETDLQTTLNTFLPPKEVFLSTVFLLQDADNIFEMKPADRLLVLKNVFNLLWIDDARDKIQEKKKEIWYKLKALEDTSIQDSKLKSALKTLRTDLKDLEKYDYLNFILRDNNDFFENIENFFDKLSLNNFSLNGLDKTSFENADNIIQSKLDEIKKLETQWLEFQNLQKTLKNEKYQNESNVTIEKNKIISLQKKIENIDEKKWIELKNKKHSLYQKWEKMNSEIDFSKMNEIINFWNEEKIDENYEVITTPTNLKEAYNCIQIFKNAWIQIKSKKDLEESNLEKINLQHKNRLERHNYEIEKLQDLKNRKNEELKIFQERLIDLEKWRNENSDFNCPDLCKKCPHISAINKQQFEQYQIQKDKLQSQIQWLKTEINNQKFDEKIQNIKNQKDPNFDEDSDNYKNLRESINKNNKFLDNLRTNLTKLGSSSREKAYTERENIQKEIQSIDQQRFKREEESKHLESYQQEKIAAETSLMHLQKSCENLENQINDLNLKIQKIHEEKESLNLNSLNSHKEKIKHIIQYYSQIEDLIKESIDNQNLSKELEEKKKKISRLDLLLSKDLVLFALDDYLPHLSEIINSYLWQCVDYTLNMCIVENWDKLELEAKISDSKWEREVKSLSWWQRTILKLVRMLAISSYLHTPLLFLDETINNLDTDTVWKVSDMINNFVKQRTMKFYTVTHNKEIQDMQIWDEIIEIW